MHTAMMLIGVAMFCLTFTQIKLITTPSAAPSASFNASAPFIKGYTLNNPTQSARLLRLPSQRTDGLILFSQSDGDQAYSLTTMDMTVLNETYIAVAVLATPTTESAATGGLSMVEQGLDDFARPRQAVDLYPTASTPLSPPADARSLLLLYPHPDVKPIETEYQEDTYYNWTIPVDVNETVAQPAGQGLHAPDFNITGVFDKNAYLNYTYDAMVHNRLNLSDWLDKMPMPGSVPPVAYMDLPIGFQGRALSSVSAAQGVRPYLFVLANQPQTEVQWEIVPNVTFCAPANASDSMDYRPFPQAKVEIQQVARRLDHDWLDASTAQQESAIPSSSSPPMMEVSISL